MRNVWSKQWEMFEVYNENVELNNKKKNEWAK